MFLEKEVIHESFLKFVCKERFDYSVEVFLIFHVDVKVNLMTRVSSVFLLLFIFSIRVPIDEEFKFI